MPRDSSGNYTLPTGINPVVSNTLIDVDWANPTLNDIATQLNNVLTRDGLLSPTGPFLSVSGSVTQPGLAFNAETGTGFYRESAGNLAIAVQGVKCGTWNTAGLNITGYAVVNRGSSGVAFQVVANNASEQSTYVLGTGASDNPNVLYQDLNWSTGAGRYERRISGIVVGNDVDNGSGAQWFEIRATAPPTMAGGVGSSNRAVAFRYISDTQVALQMVGDDGNTRSATLTLT